MPFKAVSPKIKMAFKECSTTVNCHKAEYITFIMNRGETLTSKRRCYSKSVTIKLRNITNRLQANRAYDISK